MSKYSVRLKKSEEKVLDSFDFATQKAIVQKLRALEENPYPPGCRKIQGIKDTWRIRAGNFRIVYTVYEDNLLILVIRIGDRKYLYRGI
ncbi:MAG: type II toxin-antitoxin system RelE/ParE family toxin [Synergistes sp.]|nr:type II toxin-antitoxin system RelE/ParE family toxin [Synergistes sp.]